MHVCLVSGCYGTLPWVFLASKDSSQGIRATLISHYLDYIYKGSVSKSGEGGRPLGEQYQLYRILESSPVTVWSSCMLRSVGSMER